MFHAPLFAMAGLVAAAGPLLIHLLNRRRFKVVEWAAMDFLHQAIRRSRRILRFRDLVLLALRTLCVLLFGLALARPFLQTGAAEVDPNQPIHAVLLVDNSLSMAYRKPLEGTLLEEAKERAKSYVERLPPGSRVSVLPLCGSGKEYSLGAYRTKEDVLEALAAIEPVDRRATAPLAIDLAREACRRVADPASKQVVLLSDQQVANWRTESLATDLEELGHPLQVVQVGPKQRGNAWVESLEVQDGLADLNTPAVFLAKIRYEAAEGDVRRGVEVTLTVDGRVFHTQRVSLHSGQTVEVRFPPYRFGNAPKRPAGGRAAGPYSEMTAQVSIPHDNLPDDDQRMLVVPVAASLPVLFVDQHGPGEDPRRNLYGETYRLRHLLAPGAGRSGEETELIEVRGATIGQLEREGRELLEDARLVVIGGVARPGETVPLLREYVQQGGTLVVTAGGQFDAAAWNEAAWLDGLGILPAPLGAEMVGRLPSETRGELKAFRLDFETLMGEYFHLEQVPEKQLRDLYQTVVFFKAAVADTSDGVRQRLIDSLAAEIERRRAELAGIDRELAELDAAGIRTDAQRRERSRLEDLRAPAQWLQWADPGQGDGNAPADPRALAEKGVFSTLARFTNGHPFLVERPIGRGRVLFVSSGVFRDWNNMTGQYTVVVFDRIFRRALRRTLPRRNLSTTERLVLPVAPAHRHARFTLVLPDGSDETLGVDALGASHYGLTIQNLPHRGFYRVAAHATPQMPRQGLGGKLWETTLAVAGPPEESELGAIDEAGLQERLGEAAYRWVGPNRAIGLSADPLSVREMWKWLILALFGALLLELLILAWPSIARGPAQ